jgi:hypothetical protein
MKTSRLLLVALLLLAACDAKVKVRESPDSTATVDTVTTPGRVDTVTRVDTVKVPTPPNDKDAPEPNIRVHYPRPGAVISGSRLPVKGEARTFENNVVYRLLGADGKELAKGHTTATGEMGTFSPFTLSIPLKPEFGGEATLEVFESSAKDGSVINLVKVPITLHPGEAGTGGDRPLTIYFGNTKLNPGAEDCSRVFPAHRMSSGTTAVAERALTELLRGPTATEKGEGFHSEIPAGTTLRGVTITNGVARADFGGAIATVAGACRVTAIRSQIEATLRQFESVKSVVILVDGKSEGVLQP